MYFTCLLFIQCYVNLHYAKTEAKRIKELTTNIKNVFAHKRRVLTGSVFKNNDIFSQCAQALRALLHGTEAMPRIAQSAEYTAYTNL